MSARITVLVQVVTRCGGAAPLTRSRRRPRPALGGWYQPNEIILPLLFARHLHLHLPLLTPAADTRSACTEFTCLFPPWASPDAPPSIPTAILAFPQLSLSSTALRFYFERNPHGPQRHHNATSAHSSAASSLIDTSHTMAPAQNLLFFSHTHTSKHSIAC